MSKKREKPGFYLFVRDLLTDRQLIQCGEAAFGLWVKMLCLMHDSTPRGTLPGDARLIAKRLGIPGPLRDAYAGQIGPLLDELEDNGVFSRVGDLRAKIPAEADGLVDDVIVNRRMFREWVAGRKRSAKGRAAALKRWSQSGALESGMMLGGCLDDARVDARGDARVDARAQGVSGGRTGVSGGPEMLGGMLGDCSAGCIPLPLTLTPTEESSLVAGRVEVGDGGVGGGRSGGAEQCGADQLTGEVWELVGGHESGGERRRAWWRAVVDSVVSCGGLGEFCQVLDYLRSCGDAQQRERKGLGELREPQKYLAKKAGRIVGRHGRRLPRWDGGGE